MGERARNALIDAGVVDDGGAVQLRDNAASVGDHIVTRRNSRRLVTSSGGWVVNGDIWTVLETHHDGAASVRRHTDGSTLTLPADYLAEHTHLGYATTAHRAQGMTVDRCHALVTVDASHEQLYVSATRGRHGNHLWVAVDSDHQLVREDDDLPDPEQILSTILARRDHHRLAAHQVIEDSQAEVGSLARLGAVYEDTVRRATEQWLEDLLAARGFADVHDDRQWPALVDRVRRLTLGGFEMDRLIGDAIDGRPLNDAASVAGVLHWRLGQHLADLPHARPLGPRAAIPPGDSPHAALACQAADLMARRWRDLRSVLAHEPPPRWAAPLGPRPEEDGDRRSWLNAATAVAAYRERCELPNHVAMLGERPAGTRPDAQALYDHAQQTVDRHAARQLEPLDNGALDVLDQRQHDIPDAQPPSTQPSSKPPDANSTTQPEAGATPANRPARTTRADGDTHSATLTGSNVAPKPTAGGEPTPPSPEPPADRSPSRSNSVELVASIGDVRCGGQGRRHPVHRCRRGVPTSLLWVVRRWDDGDKVLGVASAPTDRVHRGRVTR